MPEADLGSVKDLTLHEFTFTNRGTQAVAVTKAHTACGCVQVRDYTKSVAPGESGRVVVAVDPRQQQPGRHAKTVEVEFQEDITRSAVLRVLFHNRPDVVAPESIELRSVRGRPTSTTIELVDNREQPLRITRLEPNTPHTTSSVLSEPAACLPGWRYRIGVTAGADAPAGDHTGFLRIHTNDPARPVILVRVELRIGPRIRLTPASVRLTPDGGGTPAAQVFISDAIGQEVVIESVSASVAHIDCVVQPSTGPAPRVITIRDLRPNGEPDRAPITIRVQVAAPVREELCFDAHR